MFLSIIEVELHLVRVQASSTLVGPEPLRFRVQILELETKSNPIRVGCGLTAKNRS
jgi:hypothetical protein